MTLASIALLASLAAAPGDLFVDASASCATADGSAAAPFCTLTEAVAAAVDGDVVHIAAGSYSENVVVTKDVALIGLGGAEVTILDGASAGSVLEVSGSATVEVDGLTLQNGSAVGGGVRNFGTLTLRNSTVANNRAPAAQGGGGIYQGPGSGELVIERCRIAGNEVTPFVGMGAGGGILAIDGGTVTLDQTEVTSNQAGYAGGIDALRSAVVLRNTTVSDCCVPSGYMYYAVRVRDSAFDMRDSTISGNCGQGLAVVTSVERPRYLLNSTIAQNSQVYGAAGLAAVSFGGASAMRVRNTVVAQNQSVYGDIVGTVESLGHNFIGGGPTGTGIVDGVNGDRIGGSTIPLNPGLGPLEDHGGPTRTHAPLFFSPLIDAADSAFFSPMDQRGVTRVAGFADIGAHEGELGMSPAICMSNPNSTGTVGRLYATGSDRIADAAFLIEMHPLPTNATGFFLVSTAAGFIANPAGSAGNVCLSAPIGRLVGPGQVQSSGASGRIALQVDLAAIPTSMAFAVTMPGDTWVFQGWHRDAMSGAATSNFSTASEVVFH